MTENFPVIVRNGLMVSDVTAKNEDFAIPTVSKVPERPVLPASFVKWSRERKIPGSNPACTGIFPGSSHTSDLKIGTPVAILPGAWRYRVSAGTGWPGVSIL